MSSEADEMARMVEPAVAALCERHAVARMNVFGSALRDDFRPGESDIDLLVEFLPLEPYEMAKAYFGLVAELKALLARTSTWSRRGRSGIATSLVRWIARSRCSMPRSPLAYLVEAAALDQAEVTCLSDADARARRREREAERRAELDRDYLARFAGRVRELYPGAPPEQARDQVAPRVRGVLRSWRAG